MFSGLVGFGWNPYILSKRLLSPRVAEQRHLLNTGSRNELVRIDSYYVSRDWVCHRGPLRPTSSTYYKREVHTNMPAKFRGQIIKTRKLPSIPMNHPISSVVYTLLT